jgi:hypothetical protein
VDSVLRKAPTKPSMRSRHHHLVTQIIKSSPEKITGLYFQHSPRTHEPVENSNTLAKTRLSYL